jgi:signal transduction histidine kinase
MNLRSIRLRLPLTYAGIALLATLALGAVLLFTLRGYYAGLERRHLEANAKGIAAALAQLLDSGAPDFVIIDQVNSWAFFLEARVQLQDERGRLLADSGYPDARRLVTVSSPPKTKVLIQKDPKTGEVTATGDTAVINENVGLPPWQVYILPAGEAINGAVRITGFQTKPEGDGLDVLYERDPTAGDSAQPAALIYEFQTGIAPGESVSRPVTDVVTMTQVIKAGAPVGVAVPLSRSMYGFNLSYAVETTGGEGPIVKAIPIPPAPRSDQAVERPVMGASGERMGSVLLSAGPAYGNEILESVAMGWLVSGLAAVLLAGLVGWWMSRKLTDPLLALTAATGRMAAGDLSARADLHTHDELGDLSRSFNDMAGRVEATVQALRNFVGDAAHQLHTPLTALDAYLELARDEVDPARRRDYLADAEAQAGRLESVIEGLLELSRLEDNSAAHTAFDLKAVTAELAEVFASRADQADLRFRYDAPAAPVTIDGDARQVREAVANLLDNAFKFTLSGGQVELRLDADEAWARVTVTDTGIGLDAADLPRLFGRFYRGRNVAAYPGSGLGLAIVRSIAETHDGEVAVESLSPGARFTLRLPLNERLVRLHQ